MLSPGAPSAHVLEPASDASDLDQPNDAADADLIALGRAHDKAFAAYYAFAPTFEPIEDRFNVEFMETIEARDCRGEAAYVAVNNELRAPYAAVLDRGEALRAAGNRIEEQILNAGPPTTLAGLAVLARTVATWHRHAWKQPPSKRDWSERIATELAAGVMRLAGVENMPAAFVELADQAVPAASNESTSNTTRWLGYNLSDCSLRELSELYDTACAVWRLSSAETQAPWCWDTERKNLNAGGNLLDQEANRWAQLQSDVANEAQRRTPEDEEDRRDRLSLLIRHELQCEDFIRNKALVAEVTAALGVSAHG